MNTTIEFLKEYAGQVRYKGLNILFVVRLIINIAAIYASIANYGKPIFYPPFVIAVYYTVTSIIMSFFFRSKKGIHFWSYKVLLSIDFLILFSAFYFTIYKNSPALTAVPIINSIYLIIFFFYLLCSGFLLDLTYLLCIGIITVLVYIGAIILSGMLGANHLNNLDFSILGPNIIYLPLEVMKVFLLISIVICYYKLIQFLLYVLDSNNEQLLAEIQSRENSLVSQERSNVIGIIALSLAHEINNPLAGIKGTVNYIFDEENEFVKYFDVEKNNKIEFLKSNLKYIYRTRKEKLADKLELQKYFSWVEPKVRYYLVENSIDLGIDISSLKEIRFKNEDMILAFYVFLKASILEKNNILIENSIDRSQKIITTFRHFSRSLNKDDFSKIQLSNTIRNIVFLYSNFINSGREINLELDDSIFILANEQNIMHVWSHLILNAIQATDNETGRIKIKLTSEQNKALIRIIDNGKGINEEIKTKLFNPFVTTKTEGEGTGLGLFISKKIIESYGGEIYYKRDGEFTEFSVSLPLE